MDEPVSCNLIENALDYLILAGEQANDDDSERMLKHSLATLADGIELLLKARIELDGWHLLFKDVDKADQKQFEDGDFQSVTLDQAVNRLKNICGVNIEDKHLKILHALRKLRNKIRHFAVNTNRQEVISLITKGYSFVIDFTSQYLESHFGDEIKEELDTIRRMLGEFGEFVQSRLKEIQPILDSQDYALHIECPKCAQETLYPSEGHARCTFCGYDKEGENAAEDLIHYKNPYMSYKDWAVDRSIDCCPECGADACIYEDLQDCWICISCGESGNYHRCSYCDRLFTEEPAPNGSCESCWQDLLERND